MSEDARQTLAQLVEAITAHFGARLIGLYLFGSLSTGEFVTGRSDLDLIAVLDSAVTDGSDLDTLRALHEAFEASHSDWRNRIEVLYLTQDALATFADAPTGTVARVSPGEPLHLRELEGNVGWRLDWYGVLAGGETLVGPPPREVGPPLTSDQFRAAVAGHMRDLRDEVRDPSVAWVPARQGYLLATVARGLYSLETGETTSKARAVAWAAERYPDSAELLGSAYNAYRADVQSRHQQIIDFVDSVSTLQQQKQPPQPSSGRDGS